MENFTNADNVAILIITESLRMLAFGISTRNRFPLYLWKSTWKPHRGLHISMAIAISLTRNRVPKIIELCTFQSHHCNLNIEMYISRTPQSTFVHIDSNFHQATLQSCRPSQRILLPVTDMGAEQQSKSAPIDSNNCIACTAE